MNIKTSVFEHTNRIVSDRLAQLVQAEGGEFVGIQTAFPGVFPELVYLTPVSKTQITLPFDPTHLDIEGLCLRIKAAIHNSNQEFETRKISVPAATINRWAATVSSLKDEIDEALGR
jgi:hypothetical protein